jgi:hypothetical protein
MSSKNTRSQASRRRFRKQQGEKKDQEEKESKKVKNKWHPVTENYGPWVDDFFRLRYIFNEEHNHIYDKFGYDSALNDHGQLLNEEEEFKQIVAAKKSFARREEYLRAFNNLPEVIRIQEMVYNAAAKTWPNEDGQRFAQYACN